MYFLCSSCAQFKHPHSQEGTLTPNQDYTIFKANIHHLKWISLSEPARLRGWNLWVDPLWMEGSRPLWTLVIPFLAVQVEGFRWLSFGLPTIPESYSCAHMKQKIFLPKYSAFCSTHPFFAKWWMCVSWHIFKCILWGGKGYTIN